MDSVKKCTKCGKELPLDQFHKQMHRSGVIGCRSYCKNCQNELSAKWRKKNPDKCRESSAKWARTHHKECCIIRNRWRNKNLDKSRLSTAIWAQNNPQKRRAAAIKRASNTNHRLIQNIRRSIHRGLLGNSKTGHTIELLGCSVEYLRQHLENLFIEDMSWDNYGKYGWHIDHIIPLSYFDMSDPEQQKRAWHYTNLQPLWAKDNLIKGNRIKERQLILL